MDASASASAGQSASSGYLGRTAEDCRIVKGTERTASLALATAKGTGWIVGWRFATRLLGVLNTLVLARLLVPADFGLVAIATSFSQAIDGFSELSVQEALIREHTVDRAMYDTAFTLNAIRGVVTGLVILAAALPVANFFAEPRLMPVLVALALVMFASSLENIGIVDFRRDLAFEKEFLLFMVPRIIGIVAGLVVAYVWVSFWALVVGICMTRGLRLVLSYTMHPHRPRLTIGAWRKLIGFSTWAWILSVTLLIRDRIDSFVIGRVLGATQVGAYTVGWEVGFAPAAELVLPLTRALYSTFSNVRNAGGDIANAYFRAVSAAFLVTMPASLGIALIANPFVQLVFGDRWIAAVPVIQVFALVGVLKVVALISGTLLTVYGQQASQWKITMASLLVRFVLLLVLVSRLGLVGGALAAAASSLLEEILYLFLTFHRFRLRPAALLLSNWRCLVATIAMAGAVVASEGWDSAITGMNAVGFTSLSFAVLVGALTYTVVLLALWLASGRPGGAEAYAVGVLRAATKALVARRGAAR